VSTGPGFNGVSATARLHVMLLRRALPRRAWTWHASARERHGGTVRIDQDEVGLSGQHHGLVRRDDMAPNVCSFNSMMEPIFGRKTMCTVVYQRQRKSLGGVDQPALRGQGRSGPRAVGFDWCPHTSQLVPSKVPSPWPPKSCTRPSPRLLPRS
jgi:hypothetical protein